MPAQALTAQFLALMAEFNDAPNDVALENCLAWATANVVAEVDLVGLVSLIDKKVGIARLSEDQRMSGLLRDLIRKLAPLGGDGARAAASIAHALGLESASQLQALSLGLPSAFLGSSRPLGQRVRHALNNFRAAQSEASARVVLSLLRTLPDGDDWLISMTVAFAEELVRANLASALVAQDLLDSSVRLSERSVVRALAALAHVRGEVGRARMLQARAMQCDDQFSVDQHHWFALSEERRRAKDRAGLAGLSRPVLNEGE